MGKIGAGEFDENIDALDNAATLVRDSERFVEVSSLLFKGLRKGLINPLEAETIIGEFFDLYLSFVSSFGFEAITQQLKDVDFFGRVAETSKHKHTISHFTSILSEHYWGLRRLIVHGEQVSNDDLFRSNLERSGIIFNDTSFIMNGFFLLRSFKDKIFEHVFSNFMFMRKYRLAFPYFSFVEQS